MCVIWFANCNIIFEETQCFSFQVCFSVVWDCNLQFVLFPSLFTRESGITTFLFSLQKIIFDLGLRKHLISTVFMWVLEILLQFNFKNIFCKKSGLTNFIFKIIWQIKNYIQYKRYFYYSYFFNFKNHIFFFLTFWKLLQILKSLNFNFF